MHTPNTLPAEGDSSPWGRIQTVERITADVAVVTTASHGGAFVTKDSIGQVSAAGRAFAKEWSHGWGDQWFEEDAAIAHAIVAFPVAFAAAGYNIDGAAKMAARYQPEHS